MKLYFELLKYPVFTMKHVSQYYDNIESARSAVKRLIKSGLVVKIRNNLYTCISGETDKILHWRTVIKLQERSRQPLMIVHIIQI